MARPREFDEASVPEVAMLYFWSKGYEATSVRDLAEQMGFTSASLYNGFGDKRSSVATANEASTPGENLAEVAGHRGAVSRFSGYPYRDPADNATNYALESPDFLAPMCDTRGYRAWWNLDWGVSGRLGRQSRLIASDVNCIANTSSAIRRA